MKKEVISLIVVVLLLGVVSAQDYAPGEVIVKYKEEVNFNNNNVQLPGEIERIAPGEKIYKLEFDSDADVLEIVDAYEEMSNVEYAEPNFLMKSNFVPNDTSYDSLYWPEKINAERAWDFSVGSSEVIIAILDTGVDWDHPDLFNNIINRSDSCNASLDLDGNGYNGDCRGYDFTDINETNYVNAGYGLVSGEDYNTTDNDPMDFDGHGTHVAGIAGAVGDNSEGILGSCLNCSIMPVRSGFNINTPSGSNIGSLEIDDVVAAIYYAADNNATIISMSFGGGDASSVREAIEYAYSKGVILVASSGNSGSNSEQYPCAYDEVICVAATNSDDSAASYSNYGDWVSVAAPGTGILSTYFDDDYTSLSGTSMSTPLVAGAIGIIKSVFSDKNASEISSALSSTGLAVDFSGTSINRLDLYSAILYFDEIDPVVNLVSPENGVSSEELSQELICNSSDWELSNVEVKVWDLDGELFYNESKSISGSYNESSFEVNLESDSYLWNCLVTDSNGHVAYAENNYSISTVVEGVTLNNPTNDSYVNNEEVDFNCSVQIDPSRELSSFTFHLFNDSGLEYSLSEELSGNKNSSLVNYTLTEEGYYTWSCSYLDSNNSEFYGGNYSFTYDSTKPEVTLVSPEDGVSYESNSQRVEFSFEVSETSTCELVVNGDSKDDLIGVTEGTFEDDFSPNDYSWRVECTDLAGNFKKSDSRSFTVEEESEDNGNGNEEEESGESGGGGGGGGGGGSGGGSETSSSTSTQTNTTVTTPIAEEVVEEVTEEVIEESLEEENLETEEESPSASGLTGLAIGNFEIGLDELQKWKNRANIFVVFLLMGAVSLLFIDMRHEKEIAKELESLDKEK